MSKREELREKRRVQQQRQRAIWIAVIAVAAIGLAAFLIVPGIIANSQPLGAIATAAPQDFPSPQANNLGDPNAPVKVVEYSDFQCPYCRRFHEDYMPGIMKDLIATGKVYFTYEPFQIIGPESTSAAMAAMCAGDQNKFWVMHNILFANQNAENAGDFTDRRLQAMAQAAGLDMNQYNSCYTANKYQTQLSKYQAAADALGVSGTPSFSINGKLINYNQQSEILDQINAAVAAK